VEAFGKCRLIVDPPERSFAMESIDFMKRTEAARKTRDADLAWKAE
jgi:hypothetical protein